MRSPCMREKAINSPIANDSEQAARIPRASTGESLNDRCFALRAPNMSESWVSVSSSFAYVSVWMLEAAGLNKK